MLRTRKVKLAVLTTQVHRDHLFIYPAAASPTHKFQLVTMKPIWNLCLMYLIMAAGGTTGDGVSSFELIKATFCIFNLNEKWFLFAVNLSTFRWCSMVKCFEGATVLQGCVVYAYITCLYLFSIQYKGNPVSFDVLLFKFQHQDRMDAHDLLQQFEMTTKSCRGTRYVIPWASILFGPLQDIEMNTLSCRGTSKFIHSLWPTAGYWDNHPQLHRDTRL